MAPMDLDSLYTQIRRRMVETGEWDRIVYVLSAKLGEDGWMDDLKDRSKEYARSMDPLSFQSLLDDLTDHGHKAVPVQTTKEIRFLIRQYLEQQFE
ncbi:hypothetical protein AMATHDRAFT_151105 [Amanita thiersii Skay4041]|uniref:Transcription and mRNA export factor SUS1 n=1 Tax=Amanita thiersii Skay4041 TaxID=703135 RepID=A0A2A9NHZ1_9AGAR|nr:hypothetical protein AMATHDRAFT_151105 [Amanita thiersii Skay4041]